LNKAQFYTQSACFRIRVFKISNVYVFFINVVNDNSSFAGFFGELQELECL
jgi:hypothetical protein